MESQRSGLLQQKTQTRCLVSTVMHATTTVRSMVDHIDHGGPIGYNGARKLQSPSDLVAILVLYSTTHYSRVWGDAVLPVNVKV